MHARAHASARTLTRTLTRSRKRSPRHQLQYYLVVGACRGDGSSLAGRSLGGLLPERDGQLCIKMLLKEDDRVMDG